jgi:hypothetical protein
MDDRGSGSTPRPVDVPWGRTLWAVLRVTISIVGLTTLYYLAPLDRDSAASPALLAVGAVALTALLGWVQIRAILRSPIPFLRAIEALAFSIPLLILSFAAIYFVMAESDPTAFSETLTRTDALYFAVTVFSTVGFGDITPVGQTPRLVVTGQIMLDLLVLGVGLRLVVGAVQMSRHRRG